MYWGLCIGFCIGTCVAVLLNVLVKNSPKKVGPLYLLPPLLIAPESEPTLFTTPLLIVSPQNQICNTSSPHFCLVRLVHEVEC